MADKTVKIKVRATRPGFDGYPREKGDVFYLDVKADADGKPVLKSSWLEQVEATVPAGPAPRKQRQEGNDLRVEKGRIVAPDAGVSGGGGKNVTKPLEIEPSGEGLAG